MKFTRLYSAQPHNLKGYIVDVEIDIFIGLHSFNVVGLPDKAVEESRDRVGSAIKNSGFISPKSKNEKLIVSLAPAEIRKEGSFFDLAIALGYLLSANEINFDPKNKLFLGELSLNGELKPVRGIMPITQTAKEEGFNEIYVPKENAFEAAFIDDIKVFPVSSLKELTKHFDENDEYKIKEQKKSIVGTISKKKYFTDFEDVKGQETVKRGLEIAASGGHNIAMYGPPGTGKTMLARAFTSILPKIDHDDMLEITSIHSVAGTLQDGIITESPFRSPHHTASYVSIIGGGTIPKPGEITLAHKGVLFLDEFPEFDKKVLESLRQPLEDRIVNISRAKSSAQFPAQFILIAAMNPCSCGNYGAKHKDCSCSANDISRYQKKISGPIVDRIDIWLPVEHIDYEKLSGNTEKGESSEDIKERVKRARSFQKERYQKQGKNIKINSELSAKDLHEENISKEVRVLLNDSARKLSLSPRGYHRIIKLARTIADLEEKERIEDKHILEALQFRPKFFV